MHIINAVASMGKQIGIDMRLNQDGLCTMNVGSTGSLFLERRDDVLAISLAQKMPGNIMGALEKGLGLCHLDNDPQMGLRVGLFRDDTLVATCCLKAHHISAGMHEQVIPYLFDVMKQLT